MPPKKAEEPKKVEEISTPSLSKLEEIVTNMALQQSVMQGKMDTILATISNTDQRISKLEEMLACTKEENVEFRSATSNHLGVHDREILSLKLATNYNDQQQRINNIRILGFPVLNEESSAAGDGGVRLRDLVYNRILKPVLEAAVRDRFILAPVAAQECIHKIFRAGRINQGASAPPPPIIVVLSSPLIRLAIFRYKSKALPAPNTVEKEAGAKRFYLVEDLTRPTHVMFKALQASESVAKVWTTDGQIRFMKNGDDTIKRVSNVFESLEKILE